MANMPKRRKSKDNPYTLNYNDITNIYTVSFVDNKHVIHNIEVSKNVFEAFDKFELEDISQLHKMDKHYDNRNIDNSDYTDIMLFHLGKVNSKLVDEEVEEKLQNEELYKAIHNDILRIFIEGGLIFFIAYFFNFILQLITYLFTLDIF